MKAFQVTDFEKDPTIEHIQTPNPQPDQIRLKIMSCGLNFADILLKNGTYQESPQLPVDLASLKGYPDHKTPQVLGEKQPAGHSAMLPQRPETQDLD